jgi:lipoate-protein ligase A
MVERGGEGQFRSAPLEELLREDEEALRKGTASVRVGLLTGPALSLGVGQPLDEPCAQRAEGAGLPVIRRASGGTAVLLGRDDIAWSVVLPRDHPRAGQDYVHAYDRLGAALVEVLGELGGPAAAWVPSPAIDDEVCLLGARGHVLAAGGRILGGAAQHRTGRALLHHGFVLRALDWPLFGACFPNAVPASRERLAGWAEIGWSIGPEALARRLAGALARSIGADRTGP